MTKLRDATTEAASDPGLGIDDALPSEVAEERCVRAGAFDHPALRDLIASDALQRLGRIRFLGAIDYLFHPNGTLGCRRHTRLEHTLDVARLAVLYARWAGLGERDRLHLAAAALLHDVGHAPLSHSLEPVFKRRFGFGHHAAGNRMMRGAAPVGRDLPRIAAAHGIDLDRVIALIDGTSGDPGAHLFYSPINIDTLDGIHRSYSYGPATPVEPPPWRVLLAAIRRAPEDIRVLDRFWCLKGQVYHSLINGRYGVLADYTAQYYAELRAEALSEEAWYWDEPKLMAAHPLLFEWLKKVPRLGDGATPVPGWPRSIPFVARRFLIDALVPAIDATQDAARYQQEKTLGEMHMQLPAHSEFLTMATSQRWCHDAKTLRIPAELCSEPTLFEQEA